MTSRSKLTKTCIAWALALVVISSAITYQLCLHAESSQFLRLSRAVGESDLPTMYDTSNGGAVGHVHVAGDRGGDGNIETDAGVPVTGPEEAGVDKVYLDLLEEAETRSSVDYRSSHSRGPRGVVVGPTGGGFYQTVKALRNARRIRNIMDPDRDDVRLALITEKDHVDFLWRGCNNTTPWPKAIESKVKDVPWEEVCRLWENGTLFDDVIVSREPPWTNTSHAVNHGGIYGRSRYWMMAMSGYLAAPYASTMFLDSDAYPCPGFERMFAMAEPYGEKLWAFPSTAPVDLAIGLEQYKSSQLGQVFFFFPPGDLDALPGFSNFVQRNTGTVLFHFHRRLVHTFAHYVTLVAEHVYNNVASPDHRVSNDQEPFNLALYLFSRLRPTFNEQTIPMHVSCRTYPNKTTAGIDGMRNGMYPLQGDGLPCSECRCTPCLVNHNHLTYFVTVNGQKGWETNERIAYEGNSAYRWEKKERKL